MAEENAGRAPTSKRLRKKRGERAPHWLLRPCAYSLASAWVVIWVACAIWMALGTLVAKQSHDRWNEVRHALIAAAPEGQPHASLLLSIEELVARLDSREQFWDTLQMHESERLELASEIGQLQLLVKDAQENYERLLRHTNNGHESKLDSQTGAAGYRTMNYEPLSPAVQLAADEHTKVLAQLQSAKSRDAGLAARMAYLQERLGQLTMDPNSSYWLRTSDASPRYWAYSSTFRAIW